MAWRYAADRRSHHTPLSVQEPAEAAEPGDRLNDEPSYNCSIYGGLAPLGRFGQQGGEGVVAERQDVEH